MNGNESRLSLSNLVDSNAGDVGLSLQGHRADGPEEGINCVDLVAIAFKTCLFDSPGLAFIQKDIDRVIKGDSITLTCNVAEPGKNNWTPVLCVDFLKMVDLVRLG